MPGRPAGAAYGWRMRPRTAAAALHLLLPSALLSRWQLGAAAEPATLSSDCSLVPVEPPTGPDSSAGTCYREPGDPSNHDQRLIDDGPATCTGHLPPGHTPLMLPSG